jgi:enamine deaminase RidA (YjgF/YER057c/UK114 family)
MQKRVVTPPGSIAPLPGFSQAIVIELADCAIVHIAGQVALDGDKLVAPGDVAGQAAHCYERISQIVIAAGGTMADLIETRTYLLDVAELPQVAAIRGRYLADPPPTSTAVEITGLAVPGALIEIEAKAVIARG